MKWHFLFALFLLLYSCNEGVKPNSAGYDENNVREKTEKYNNVVQIQALMHSQELAWNAGQLARFMQAYSHSDSLVFIGSRGLSYGWQTTLDNYTKSYPDKEKMGTLKFENDKIEVLNPNAAWVAGRWNLFRKTDTLTGSYLLVWKKINGSWKIIADHSS